MRSYKPPHPASRVLTAAGLLLSTPILAMACSAVLLPDNEPIAEARLAVVPGQNNPPCGASACPTGQVRTCGDVCVTPVGLGDPCSQDDCKADSVCDPHFGASCMPIGLSQFLCALPPVGEALLSECDPTKNECPADLFCKNVGRCFPDSGLPSLCSVGIPEGHVCDSNWDDAYVPGSPPSTSKCRPCMPGTTCVNGRCHKPCTTTSDCPCSDDGDQSSCISNPVAADFCYVCRSLGEACSFEHKCCDAGTQCSAGRCCKKSGEACTAQTDCCGGNNERCIASTGECGACKQITESCTTNDDCCQNKCSSGVCVSNCKDDLPCSTGLPGICASGKTKCLPTGGTQCTAPDPEEETCNGKDDDCDGIVDNIDPAECQDANIFEGTDCQSGFKSKGHKECLNGKTICVAEAHKDFCAQCGGTLANGDYCGVCAGTPCGLDPLCLPNMHCNWGICQSMGCADPNPPACWHAKYNGACCTNGCNLP